MAKNKSDLINEINALTVEIETNHEELYRSLNEEPVTIPNIQHPSIDVNALMQYRDSLKQILSHYLDSHTNLQPNKTKKDE